MSQAAIGRKTEDLEFVVAACEIGAESLSNLTDRQWHLTMWIGLPAEEEEEEEEEDWITVSKSKVFDNVD